MPSLLHLLFEQDLPDIIILLHFLGQASHTQRKEAPQVGLEPTTSGLEVRRAIHCATGASHGRWWCESQLMFIWGKILLELDQMQQLQQIIQENV